MIRRILVPLDGSQRSRGVLAWVRRLATAFGAKVDLLGVVSTGCRNGEGLPDPLSHRVAQAEASRHLREIQVELRESGLRAGILVEGGDPAEVIVSLLHRGDYDLVALTPHGQGGGGYLKMGSTATAVALNTPTSILIVPTPETEEEVGNASLGSDRGGIMAPVDCSPRSDWSATVAAALALGAGSKLKLVHVLGSPEVLSRLPSSETDPLYRELQATNRLEAERYVEETVVRLRGRGIDVEGLVESSADGAADALFDLAAKERPDLIVISAHGRGASPEFPFGGTASKLVFSPRYPILLLQDVQRDQDALRRSPEVGPRTGLRGTARERAGPER